MYRPLPQHQPPWGVPIATASENHQGYVAADPYGTAPWPQAQQQQSGFQDPHAAAPFHQHQNHHYAQRGIGRGQPGDELALRLKEEQRRKQVEYSQALAEQVRQRELQKQQEREARRREDAAEEAAVAAQAVDMRAPPRVDRGLFDGLGQNNPSQRANFGRGRREPPPNQAINQPRLSHSTSQQQFLDPRFPNRFPQHAVPQDAGEPQFAHPFPLHGQSQPWGVPQPEPAEFVEHGGVTPRQEGPWAQPPAQQDQPHAGGGRRIRTDLHNGGNGGGIDEARRRQQQQQDMQDALRRQIEEKQRQKLEEKRKRDEEERREMEKFEHEKRRQQEEQERLKGEKRRKALAEEQQLRAQQQQLEAAAAAAAQEQRQQRQRHSPTKPSPTQFSGPPTGQTPAVQRASMQKNPFTNSRARLFEDPSPPPQTHQSHFVQPPHLAHHQQRQFNPPEPQFPYPVHTVPSEPPCFQHQAQPQSVSRHSINTRTLMEQYEQVREELERQRRLVEQLHAHMQQQQQKQTAQEPRDLPTISDLERLRQELREELEQREAHHRHELVALRRQQEQQQQESPPRAFASPQSAKQQQDGSFRRSSHRALPARGPRGRRHNAFVQDALEDEEEEEEEEEDVGTSEEEEQSITSDARRSNQRLSPVASALRQGPSHRLRGSLSQSSLQCESKLVFFSPTHCEASDVKVRTEAHPEERLDDSVDDLVQELTQSVHRNPGRRSVGNQEDPVSQIQSPITTEDGKRDDGDSLEFFVRRFDVDTPNFDVAEPARYSRSSLSSPMQRSGLNERVLAILDEVSDDDYDSGDASDDESLTGESLEAIFQRNLRRHEILTGFENKVKAPGPMHWRELRDLLHEAPAQVDNTKKTKPLDERLLVASSRWLPSSLVAKT